MFKFSELLKQTTKREFNYCITGFIAAQIIIITALCIYVFFYKTSIGVVNITGIVDEFVKTQSRSNLSREELREVVKVFGVSLEKTMHDISAKKHIILMPAEAVISGAEDYTQEVQERLAKITQVFPREKQLPQEGSQITAPPQVPNLEKQLLSQREERYDRTTPIAVQSPGVNQSELLQQVPAN